MTEAAGRLDPFLDAVRAVLADAGVAPFDDTGARVAGRLHGVHAASTGRWTRYTLQPGRGIEAVDAAGVLADVTGVAVHNRWKRHRHDRDLGHGLCSADHLREFTAEGEQPGQGWADDVATLRCETLQAVDAARGNLPWGAMPRSSAESAGVVVAAGALWGRVGAETPGGAWCGGVPACRSARVGLRSAWRPVVGHGRAGSWFPCWRCCR